MELSSDKNWRTKQAVVEQFPLLAKQLGEAFYIEKINPICIDLIKDPIYTIRDTALKNFLALVPIFGANWVVTNILPPLMACKNEINYLHRLTTLFAVAMLAPALPVDVTRQTFLPVLMALHTDKVANVRMNVAKSIQALLPACKGHGDLIE